MTKLCGPVEGYLQVPLQKALLPLCCSREEAVTLGSKVGPSGGFTPDDWGRKYDAYHSQSMGHHAKAAWTSVGPFTGPSSEGTTSHVHE